MDKVILKDEVKSEEIKKEELLGKDTVLSENLPILEEMIRMGLFLGHKKAKTHPKARTNIFTIRNGVAIFDLSKTLEALEKVSILIKLKISENKGIILMTGTTPASKIAVEDFAKKLNFPYVTERWLGGTLTNFRILSKRIAYFKKLRADRVAGKFDKYTKKERLDIDREIAKLTLKFSGVENMEELPAILFVADLGSGMTAVREAKKSNIPVVAIANSDANPELVEYPIPCNGRSKLGIEWILAKLEEVVKEARKPAVK